MSVAIASLIISPLVAAEDVDYDFYSSNNILFYDPNATGTCSAPAPDDSYASSVDVGKEFSLGSDKSKRAVNLVAALVEDYGFKDFQAAGVVGNFMHESGGKHVPPNVNEGGQAGPPKFSGGYGWAQWTGGRQTAFIDFAVANKYMASRNVDATDAANYAYLNHELTKTAEEQVIPALRKTTNAREAAGTWEEVFERAGVKATEARQDYAEEVLQAYKTGGGISGAGSSGGSSSEYGEPADCAAQSGPSTTNSPKFGNVTFPLAGGQSVVNNKEIFKNGTTSLGGHPYTAYDIYANAGTKVIAFMEGTVNHISSDKCGSRLVTVYNKQHDVVVSYMHMTTNGTPSEGSKVQPGQQIGFVASVKQYSCVNVDHLHIDVMKGSVREACAREYCPDDTKRKFIDIGPDLFNAYEASRG